MPLPDLDPTACVTSRTERAWFEEALADCPNALSNYRSLVAEVTRHRAGCATVRRAMDEARGAEPGSRLAQINLRLESEIRRLAERCAGTGALSAEIECPSCRHEFTATVTVPEVVHVPA